MTDLIIKDKVLEILKNLGGCDAKDEYSKGWDDAIDAAYNDVGNLPSVAAFTEEELHTLSSGLGELIASRNLKELESIDFSSILKKFTRMMEV